MHVLIPALHRPIKPTGVCRHAANLAQCLANTESVSHVTLVVGEWQQRYFEQSFNLNSPKIQLVSINIKNRSLSRNRWFMFGLPKLAQKIQPDIIHLSFPLPFVRQWFEASVVSTIHDLYPYEYPENFGYPQVWFNQLFLRQCIHNSDSLICVSKCTKKTLDNHFPRIRERKETAVIYNIVDFEGIKSSVPQQFKDSLPDSFLLTVAQHRKNKNLSLLIQAYSELLREGLLPAENQLLLVGSSGPETEQLIHLVQTLKLENQVLFLSGLADGELRWLYEHASLFIIPSSTEGFCLPLVEALTVSCPVVCSDIPIFREVGASRCIYFELAQQACHNLKKAMTEATLSGSYCNLTQETLVDSRFSSEEVSQQLLNFYESL